MTVLYALLMTAALFCFLGAALTSRVDLAADFNRWSNANLVALGLAFWAAVPFIQYWKAV